MTEQTSRCTGSASGLFLLASLLMLGLASGAIRAQGQVSAPDLQSLQQKLAETRDPKLRAPLELQVGKLAAQQGPAVLQQAYENLAQARLDASGDSRLRADASGALAQLYESAGRGDESLRLNDQAILDAQAVGARDLLLELEWRKGRLLEALNKKSEALAAYQRAVDHIEAIRQDIPVEYHDGRSSFRETLEPVYQGLARLQLDAAEQASGDAKLQMLRHARNSVELIKQSEMDDFLGGRCAVMSAKSAAVEDVEAGTAVIYPIIFPDHLDMIVSQGAEIQQFSQPVDAKTLEKAARSYVRLLRSGTGDPKARGGELYRWLVAPADAWLRQRQVKTLVVVPDGVLRLVPYGALFDGHQFLIERYGITVSPGLTLASAAPPSARSQRALLAGMSEPGPVMDHLPASFMSRLVRSVDPARADAGEAKSRDVEAVLRQPAVRQQIKEKLSLPGVATEIDALQKEMPNTRLMNQGFTVAEFKDELIKSDYGVVHIASHGVFGSSAETSFIMAYDGILDMNELERLFKSEKYKKAPLDLLTLSACQTAEGDDRAPLGFSGMAIKAHVRSALGSLWPVSDEATSKFMETFYRRLQQPGTTKAEALRQAQLGLLGDTKMQHPFYWSAFVLAGNWL